MNHLNFLTGGVVLNSINVDFDIGAINAVRGEYPKSNVYGCLFHLSKNVYKKVQANGLAELYLNDQVFRKNIRMVCALAFVPIPDIQRSFNALCQICGNGEVPIIDYFARNYVGELRNGIWRSPILEHELWSVYDRMVNNLSRTTRRAQRVC